MEAKDTVMSANNIATLGYDGYDKDQNMLLRGEQIPKALERQADISFKAGIKEVVEWIIENNGTPDHILDLWQAKLKEWQEEK